MDTPHKLITAWANLLNATCGGVFGGQKRVEAVLVKEPNLVHFRIMVAKNLYAKKQKGKRRGQIGARVTLGLEQGRGNHHHASTSTSRRHQSRHPLDFQSQTTTPLVQPSRRNKTQQLSVMTGETYHLHHVTSQPNGVILRRHMKPPRADLPIEIIERKGEGGC